MTKYLGDFKVADYENKKSKLGTPYLRLMLENGYGTAFCFDNIEKAEQTILNNIYIRIHGTTFTRNSKSFIRVLKAGAGFVDFYEPYLRRLKSFGETLSDNYCRAIFNSFFDDVTFTPDFLTHPASINGHHAFSGGLLVHTTDCMEMGIKMLETSSMKNVIDRDVLLLGLFLHDIGKTQAYSCKGNDYQMSDEGRAVGHVNLGHQMFEDRCRRIEGLPKPLKNTLANIILSHHNSGSVKPLYNEAVMVKRIDSISAWSDLCA